MAMCMGGLPVAVAPLWQLAQFPLTPEWSKRTSLQLPVEWQASHALEVGTWVGCFPVACTPLWQLAQPFEMPEWLNVPPAKLVVP